MAKLTIPYGHPDDPAEFERYYTEKHLPLAQTKMPNVKDFELTQVVAAPAGEELPYYRIAELWWEDVETLQAALASDDGKEVIADMDNFVTGDATLLISNGQS